MSGPAGARWRTHSLPALCGALLLLMGTSACQSSAAVATPGRPARLVAPGPECLGALSSFAAQATGKPVPPLGGAAFADGDTLWLEPGQARDAQGRRLDGASLGRPHTLRLTLDTDGRCVVKHAESGRQAPMPGCTCVALAVSAP